MPVRSLNSAVLKWPDRDTVIAAAKKWAADLMAKDPSVLRVGIIGSCGRGDWGVGSDLDLLIEISETDVPFITRAADFDIGSLPVPTDLIVYTSREMQQARAQGTRFIAEADRNAIWLSRSDVGQ